MSIFFFFKFSFLDSHQRESLILVCCRKRTPSGQPGMNMETDCFDFQLTSTRENNYETNDKKLSAELSRSSGSPFPSIGQRTPWNLYLSRESSRNLPVETTDKTQEKDLLLRTHIEKSRLESSLEVGPHIISGLVIQIYKLLLIFS